MILRSHTIIFAALAACTLAAAPAMAPAEEGGMIRIPDLTAVDETAPASGNIDVVAGEMDLPSAAAARMQFHRPATGPVPVAVEAREPILSPLLSPMPILPGQTRLRLQGEFPEAEFTLFLPQGTPRGQLVLDHESGVDVLPDRSSMEVFVNDVSVGTFPLGKSSGDAPDSLAVPSNVWLPGANRVRIALSQVHRIYCGPEAAFDLWTDLDLATSGALIDERPMISGSADFVAAVARDAVAGRAIELRDPGGIAEGVAATLDIAAYRLGQMVGGHTLRYAESSGWPVVAAPAEDDATAGAKDTTDGGEAAPEGPSHARITLIHRGALAIDDGRPDMEFRRAGDGAEVLVLRLDPQSSNQHVDAALGVAFDELMAHAREDAPGPSPTSGLSVGAGTLMRPGGPVRLSDLGMQTIRTSSHYFHRSQVFTLPRDWLILTAQKAVLHLDYAYARKLPDEAKLLIKVNGETVRLLPLVDEGGVLIEQFPVKFAANLLREGPNLLQFEALIPGAPSDFACPENAFPKLEIRGSTTLTVPASPRMRVPDLRGATAALRAGNLDLASSGAADLSMADRLSLVTALGMPSEGAAHLTVLSADALPRLPMGDYSFSPLALRDVLTKSPIVELPLPAYDARIGEVPDDSPFIGPVAGSESPRTARLAGLFGQAVGTVAANVAAVQARLLPDADADADAWLDAQRGQAILLQLDVTRPDRLWLVLGPRTDFAHVAARLAAGRRSIAGPNGQMAVLGHDDTWRSWADSRRMPELRERLTLANFRQVAGNYASWRPLYFTAALFGVALVFAALALRLVVLTRRPD